MTVTPAGTCNGVLETPFTSGSQHFSADQLGWEPAVTDKSGAFATPDTTYTNDATAGTAVLPAVQATDHALGSPQTLASATAGGGLGVAHLDAKLHVLIPVFAEHGQYSAVCRSPRSESQVPVTTRSKADKRVGIGAGSSGVDTRFRAVRP